MNYTPEEIKQMPAGRDLDAAVMEVAYGWHWMKYQSPNRSESHLLTSIFPPDAPNRICVANRYDSVWLPSDRHAERFSDWDQCSWWEDGDHRFGFPHYSTNIADAWTLLPLIPHLTFPNPLIKLTPDFICRQLLFQRLLATSLVFAEEVM